MESLPIVFPSSPDGGTSLIIDKTVPIAQLAVAHRHNLLLFRTGENCNGFCVHNNTSFTIYIIKVSARIITFVSFG